MNCFFHAKNKHLQVSDCSSNSFILLLRGLLTSQCQIEIFSFKSKINSGLVQNSSRIILKDKWGAEMTFQSLQGVFKADFVRVNEGIYLFHATSSSQHLSSQLHDIYQTPCKHKGCLQMLKTKKNPPKTPQKTKKNTNKS